MVSVLIRRFTLRITSRSDWRDDLQAHQNSMSVCHCAPLCLHCMSMTVLSSLHLEMSSMSTESSATMLASTTKGAGLQSGHLTLDLIHDHVRNHFRKPDTSPINLATFTIRATWIFHLQQTCASLPPDASGRHGSPHQRQTLSRTRGSDAQV